MGEISCRALGAKVESFSPTGESLVDEVGELVITAPMPSMPVFFWGDEDGSRLRDSYFADYPGVWRHGDWIRITSRGSCVIEGRSDATLNRGGVRMGTAEFYRVVESVPEVADSLVVDTSSASGEGDLLLFVVLDPAADVGAVTKALRTLIRTELSPRHVPGRGGPGARGAKDTERQEMRGAGEADPRRRSGRVGRVQGCAGRPGGLRRVSASSARCAGRRRSTDEVGSRLAHGRAPC